MYSDEDVARVVHEATRALQYIQGDPAPAEPWNSFSDDRRKVVIDGVRRARNGESPRELHESWREDLLRHGWKYGLIKDPEAKTHPCLMPYDQLPGRQKDKDELFVQIVIAMSIRSVTL